MIDISLATSNPLRESKSFTIRKPRPVLCYAQASCNDCLAFVVHFVGASRQSFGQFKFVF